MKNSHPHPCFTTIVSALALTVRNCRVSASTVLVTLLLTAVLPTADARPIAPNGVFSDNSSMNVRALESRAFSLANAERSRGGLAPLVWNEKAAEVARSHSKDMAEFNYLSHTDHRGRRVVERARDFGLFEWRALGENVAWLSGYEDPAGRVVDRWMASTGHRKNILQASYREAGVGLAVSPSGKYYFTQVFVLLR